MELVWLEQNVPILVVNGTYQTPELSLHYLILMHDRIRVNFGHELEIPLSVYEVEMGIRE